MIITVNCGNQWAVVEVADFYHLLLLVLNVLSLDDHLERSE